MYNAHKVRIKQMIKRLESQLAGECFNFPPEGRKEIVKELTKDYHALRSAYRLMPQSFRREREILLAKDEVKQKRDEKIRAERREGCKLIVLAEEYKMSVANVWRIVNKI